MTRGRKRRGPKPRVDFDVPPEGRGYHSETRIRITDPQGELIVKRLWSDYAFRFITESVPLWRIKPDNPLYMRWGGAWPVAHLRVFKAEISGHSKKLGGHIISGQIQRVEIWTGSGRDFPSESHRPDNDFRLALWSRNPLQGAEARLYGDAGLDRGAILSARVIRNMNAQRWADHHRPRKRKKN